jgi:hypothetical protein
MRMIWGPDCLTRRISHWAYLVEHQERIDLLQTWRWHWASHQKTCALELLMGGNHSGDMSGCWGISHGFSFCRSN